MAAAPRLHVAAGARETEAALLAAVRAARDAVRREPALLARPVRVVVPSRSLRAHVSERIAREVGAVAGLVVQTLYAAALDVLRGAGESVPAGERLFPLLVAQAARGEPELARALDPLEDGYGAVGATASDLLDAGFEPVHAEALDERLAEAGGPAAARARALVRATARVAARLDTLGVGHRSELLARAARCLADGPAVLPSRALLIHGFADATGRAADLLEALLRQEGAQLFIDRPPDPVDPGGTAGAARFADRLQVRLTGAVVSAPPAERAGGAPALVRARGVAAEVRAVVERVQACIEAGAIPERIGVVARQLEPFASPLRIHLTRLGVPFSGAPGATGPLDPEGRQVQALLDLLERRERVTADRWLDLRGGARNADLRLAFHAAGAGRLEDAAALDPEARAIGEGVPLPVRRGLAGGDDSGGDDPGGDDPGGAGPDGGDQPGDGAASASAEAAAARGPRARRRWLPIAVLREAVADAARLCEHLKAWPEPAPCAQHVGALRAMLAACLPGARAGALLGATLDELATLPGALPVAASEFLALLRRAVAGLGRATLGGAGAGVQVLTVMEARARSFDHLFVLGLNRDRFPRPVEEDWLLPDTLRGALATLLPDMPIKERGHDEERYLFAQLLSAAPQVTLSFQAVDEDGRECPPSPLLERLRTAEATGPLCDAPDLTDPAPRGERPAHELARAAGLHGSREDFGAWLALALHEQDVERAETVAAARAAALDEHDPAEPLRAGVGPFLGLVGAATRAADLRRGELYVTTLEGVARCPWQAFLEKLLRLEPVPDSLQALPELDNLLVGRAVHAALEAVAARQGVPCEGRLADVAGAAPAARPWPGEAELEACARAGAEAALREAGQVLPGFDRVLTRCVLPFLELASELAAGASPLGAELQGGVVFPVGADADAPEVELFFRADRVERREGRLSLIDFKTGKSPLDFATPAARRKHLLTKIREGRLLQGGAYARAGAAASGHPASGRYLWLRAGKRSESHVGEVASDDAELMDAFDSTVAALLGAWQQGVFVPRLVASDGDQEPTACSWCEVAEACLRGDSGARRRMHGMGAEALGGAADPVLRELWWLGKDEKQREKGRVP